MINVIKFECGDATTVLDYYLLKSEDVELLKFTRSACHINRWVYASKYMNVEYDYIEAETHEEAVEELIGILYDYLKNIVYEYEQMIESIEETWESQV